MGILASKLSLTVILSPGLMFSFTSSILTYLFDVDVVVQGLDVVDNGTLLGCVLVTVSVWVRGWTFGDGYT